jgi:hypothetical protein
MRRVTRGLILHILRGNLVHVVRMDLSGGVHRIRIVLEQNVGRSPSSGLNGSYRCVSQLVWLSVWSWEVR